VERADGIVSVVAEAARQLLGHTEDAPSVKVHRPVEVVPDEAVAAAHHLVVMAGPMQSSWSDTSVSSALEAEELVKERLFPWVSRWQEGRRAPRTQTAVLLEPDPSWAPAAARLIARLGSHINSPAVLRIDHIGSTSVDGLAAKNLIDIQIIVATDADGLTIAQSATGAGFVHVGGQWHGKDRHGQLHPEQVCVDADPGRPVNINIRAVDRPVARDALLFRDWLRANSDARARYLSLKLDLAGRHVDDYGDGKEPFISAALHDAETWASRTGWAL
jgi:dephospho-CoA kinase